MLLIIEANCEKNDLSTFRTSPESHLHWKNRFHKNSSFFWIHADFEADNEIDKSSIGLITTSIYKQNPVATSYHITSELEDVLQSVYYKSPVGYNNINWFINKVIKLETKKAFYFKNTKKDIIMTEKDEEDYIIDNICRFCEKKTNLIKLEIIVT